MKPKQQLRSNWGGKPAVRKEDIIEVFIERKLEELFLNQVEKTTKSKALVTSLVLTLMGLFLTYNQSIYNIQLSQPH